MPQVPGPIITNKNTTPQKVLEIKPETDGVKLVQPEDEKSNKADTQIWTVTTVKKDSKIFHMFSINDFVLTGKWNINVQGNISAETKVGCITNVIYERPLMCIATYFKTKIGQ